MATMAALGRQEYRATLQHGDFIELLNRMTPLKELGRLNNGSRPSKRKETKDLNDLRAISWNFSWTQTRLTEHCQYHTLAL